MGRAVGNDKKRHFFKRMVRLGLTEKVKCRDLVVQWLGL